MSRQEHSVVAAAGEIYVIGGYAPNVTDSVQAYDPAKDSWRDVESFPTRLNHGNAGVIGNTIYVAGFYINGGMSTATTEVYAYDPASDNWLEKSPLPSGTQRAAGCVATDADLMYVIGGAHEGKSVAAAARYDAAADEWEELPPLPERREHCTAGAINGVVYVAGGRADTITGVQPKTWAFDVTAKTWAEVAALPTPRGGLAGAVLGDRLFVFGGEGNSAASSGVFPNIDAYDPATNSWQALPPMLVPRHGYGAASIGGRIYLAGGATRQGAGAVDQNSVFFYE
jgi:N-acetylneuraminic acid mutarotase